MKPVHFEGSSQEDLRALPKEVRIVVGFQLDRLQRGQEPKNWKPLRGLGNGISGVREIRIEIRTNIYRSAYVTTFGEAIVVLHCWNKKTDKTAASDKRLIVERYKSAKATFS